MGERGSQIPRLHHGGYDADDTSFQYELFACGQCVFGDDYVLGGGCTSLQTLVEGCRSRYDSFGGKKKLLGSRRFCAKLNGLSALASIVKACPEHRATLEYLGAMYIVANQRSEFLALMKQYMGTKAMPHIPASFAKAMEVFCKNPE